MSDGLIVSCVYCGVPLAGHEVERRPPACNTHLRLVAADPSYVALRPLSEGEQLAAIAPSWRMV